MIAALSIFFVNILVILVYMVYPKYPWIILGVPFGLFFVLLSIKFPQISLMALAALIPMDMLSSIFPALEKVTLFKILFPIPLLVIFYKYIVLKDKPIHFTAMDKWLLIWALLNCFLIFFSVDKLNSFNYIRRSASLWLFYYVISRLFISSEWQPKLSKVIVFAFFFSVLVGTLSFVIGKNPFADPETDLIRISGASKISPNEYAVIIMLPLLLSFFHAFNSKGYKRLVYGFICLPLILGVIYTYSRSAFVTLFLISLLLVFRYRKNIKVTTIIFMFIVIPLMAPLLIPLVPADYKQRILSLFSSKQDRSVMKRLNYIRVGWNVFKQYPLFGCGPGNFALLHAKGAFQPEPSLIGIPRQTHNTYLSVVTETGIVGVVVFTILMSYVLITSFKLTKHLKDDKEYSIISNSLFYYFLTLALFGFFAHLLLTKILWLELGFIRALDERRLKNVSC